MSRRRDPFKDIEELFDRLNAGFGDLGRELETEFGQGGDILVDVADADGHLVVTADVPGFEKDDISVSVSGRKLTVAAAESTEQETQDEDAHYYRRERSQRRVSRTITLPVDVDETAASATYENGVLTVELPKQEADDRGTDIDVS